MRSERSVGWGVAMIVIVGTVLGLTHNWAGLRGRPPHGIPWVNAEPAAVSLESLTGQDGATAPPSESPSAESGEARPAAPREGASPVVVTPKSPPAGERRAPTAGSPPPASASAGTDESGAVASPPATRAMSLPFIPNSSQPIEVKAAVAKAFFDADAALFIDARDPEEYAAGHIPRAIRLTHNDAMAEPERLESLPLRGRPIIAYCSGGACEASHDLARDLIAAGHRKVMVYTGGFPEWASSGHPVERGGE